MKKKSSVYTRLFLIVAIFVFPCLPALAEVPEILVLLSYDPAFPASPDIAASLEKSFPHGDYNVYVHFMNSKRIPGPDYLKLFRQEVSLEIVQSGKPDLVLACDDNALRFAVDNRSSLFPGVSIVFAGINDYRYVEGLTGQHGITGVMEVVSVSETVDLMRRMFPKMSSLDVIVDSTESCQAVLQDIGKDEIPLPIKIMDISRMSEEIFIESLKARPAEQPLLLIGAYSGGGRKIYSFWESLSLIRKSTASPVFHLWKHGIGSGLIGGVVVSHYEQIRAAANLAKRILAGERAENIPFIRRSPNVTVLDWNELTRFRIPTKAIPRNAQIINKPLTLRESQPTVFWIFIVALTAATGLATALFIILRYRAKATDQLARNVTFLGNLINSIETPIYLKNVNGEYTMVNNSFAQLAKKSAEWIRGKKSSDLLSKENSDELESLDRAILAGYIHGSTEITFPSNEESRVFIVTKVPIEDTKGTTLILSSMQDITAERQLTENLRTENTRLDAIVAERTEQLEKANRELQAVSETDQLTKLANRRKTDECISDEIEMAKRYDHRVALIMFDLDHFKQVNDQLGHPVGDQVLVAIAGILAQNCRVTDLASRWGGEEFLIVCKGSNEEGAAELAEKIREKIESARILQDRSVTASFGVCAWRKDDTHESLLQRVDNLLYEAKHAGRNCVVRMTQESL